MSQQLESKLREGFALKASAIPTQAGERLHGIDYRPRTGRTLPRVTVASLAGVAATTGVVASGDPWKSQPAFAGWSPSPTPASAVQTASAESACQAQLSAAPARPDPASAGASHPWVTSIATDVRGPFTLVIYESGATNESCLSGPTITMVSETPRMPPARPDRCPSPAAGGRGHGTLGAGSGVSISTGPQGSGSITHLTVAHLNPPARVLSRWSKGRWPPG